MLRLTLRQGRRRANGGAVYLAMLSLALSGQCF